LVVACLVHLAAQGLIRGSAPRGRPVGGPSSAATVLDHEITLDLGVGDLEAALQRSPSPEEEDGTHVGIDRRVASIHGSRARDAVDPSERDPGVPDPSSSGEASGGPESAPPPASSAWTFDPMRNPTRPNIVPRSVDLVAANGGRAAAEAPPAPASTTGGLIEGLDAADVSRGLGRGGPVRTAIDLAARDADAPLRGNATFSVTIFSDGAVDVQVAGNHTDWARLVPAIREAVRKAQVQLPPNSRGLSVVVAVDAKMKYPDGYEPPKKNTVTVQPALAVDKPWLDVRISGRRCSAAFAIAAGGVAGGADCAPGSVGRVVSTRIVSEGRL